MTRERVHKIQTHQDNYSKKHIQKAQVQHKKNQEKKIMLIDFFFNLIFKYNE